MYLNANFGDEQDRVRYPLICFTILLLVAITLWIIILKLRSPAGKGFLNMSPAIDVVWAMYESALREDINGYINCFVPDSQSLIRETLKSMGEKAFKAYIRNKAAGVMGVSIYSSDTRNLVTTGINGSDNPDKTDIPQRFEGNMISLPVEIVFKERNEIQVFELKQVGKAWKISNISTPILTPQPIPFGKNVNE
jgi:hypothetical protein